MLLSRSTAWATAPCASPARASGASPTTPTSRWRCLSAPSSWAFDFIDTADSYGPFVSEDLIAEALAPYPDGLVIATKGGLLRTGPGDWRLLGKPDYLRQAVRMSLRRLELERIDLYQLHRIDPEVPAADQFAVLKEFQDEGLVRLVGLSEVGVDEIKQAQGRRARRGDGPERVQPGHAQALGRGRLLRRAGHRIYPVVPAQRRQAGRLGRARGRRRAARRVAQPGRARVAAQALAGECSPSPARRAWRTWRRTRPPPRSRCPTRCSRRSTRPRATDAAVRPARGRAGVGAGRPERRDVHSPSTGRAWSRWRRPAAT